MMIQDSKTILIPNTANSSPVFTTILALLSFLFLCLTNSTQLEAGKESKVPVVECLDFVSLPSVCQVGFCPTVVLQAAFNPFGGGAGAPDFMVLSPVLQSLIPFTQPYNIAPWNYGGTESLAAIPADMVDWILLIIRDGNNPNLELAWAAGILHSDGSIKDVNSNTLLIDVGPATSGYYLQIIHRNHLAITSAFPLQPDPNGNICFDFTFDMNQAYRDPGLNTDPQTALPGLFGLQYGMIAGNAQILDCQVDTNDLNLVMNDLTMINVYSNTDVNLDGQVDANDVNLASGNIADTAHVVNQVCPTSWGGNILCCNIEVNTITPTDETCPGANDGTITVNAMAMGCTGTIEYSLDGGMFQASNVFMGVAPGGHTIVFRCSTNTGCSNSAAATVGAGMDSTPPMITCPASTTIECGTPIAFPTPTFNDNCDPNPGLAFSDVSNMGCGLTEITTRTWTTTDASGNSSTCSQTITVVDNTPPVIICPPNVSIACDAPAGYMVHGMATATDVCDPNPVVTHNDVIIPGNCTGNSTIVRTWTATDDCGNSSTCSQTIARTDTTPPVITCPANVTIDCTADTSPANTGMATAVDNCNTIPTITSSDVTTPGACPQEMTITRTWVATDACGNSSMCTQTITVDDSTPPVAPANPTTLTIQCLSDVPAQTEMTAPDDCGGNITVLPTDVFTPGNCSSRWTVTRTWTFDDGCGNVSTTTQIINVVDNSPTISIIAPPDQTINCSYNVFPNPGAAIVITPCGSTTTITTSTSVNGPPNCPGTTYNVVYTVMDDCGRSALATQVFTVQNDPPEFVCPPDICIIDCPNNNDEIQEQFDAYADLAMVNTSCSGDISITNNFNPNGFFNQNCNTGPVNGIDNVIRWQIVIFTATDQCGRSTTCMSLVVITDHTPPTISGSTFDAIRYNNALAQSEYNAWIQQNLANLTAVDECNNSPTGIVSWSWSPASPNTTINNGPFATTLVTFTASDGCGNASIITAVFQLKEEPTANVTGGIYNEQNEEVEHVEVSLNDLGMGQMDSYMTGADGQYSFQEVGVTGSYEVIPYRNDDPLNGVSTLDLIYISMHILGIDELDSPYQLIAADANNSGTITSADLVEIRKLILYITEEFSNLNSWRFVDEGYVFPDPTNPFASTFPEVYNINGMILDVIADFIAIKIGDVSGDAIANELQNGDTRTAGELNFMVEDRQLEIGKVYTIDFKAKDFTEVLGYQFSLNFDATDLEFVDVTAGDLRGISADNFGYQLLDRGVLTSSWNNREGVSISD